VSEDIKLGGLSPVEGSRSKPFRRGRGHGSGNGKTAGKGHKGQKARSGAPRPGFEGGQMPLYRRLPKRGFTCINSKEIISLNVSSLDVFEDGAVVDLAALKGKGLVSNPRDGVKILGGGEISKKLTVKVEYFSESAKEKIEAAGGTTESTLALRSSVSIVKLSKIEAAFNDGETVTAAALKQKGLAKADAVKIVAIGKYSKKINFAGDVELSNDAAKIVAAKGGKHEKLGKVNRIAKKLAKIAAAGK
jgi:large subunit ribosomal protein L15